jgi:hypothetical protein
MSGFPVGQKRRVFMKRALVLLCCFLVAGLAVSAQDLTVDYQFNVAAKDSGNYLSYSGPLRLVTVNKDTLDAVSGASKQRSTALFSAYQTDITGKAAFPSAVRGLFLYPVAPDAIRTDDVLQVSKASNGVITIQFAHRGVAHRIITDAQGKVTFPKGNYAVRTIGYIQGAGPQVISTDFSSDGTAARIDWAKVWDAKVPTGKAVQGSSTAKTGAITNDWETSTIFQWSGPLQFSFDRNILKISGQLKAIRP